MRQKLWVPLAVMNSSAAGVTAAGSKALHQLQQTAGVVQFQTTMM